MTSTRLPLAPASAITLDERGFVVIDDPALLDLVSGGTGTPAPPPSSRTPIKTWPFLRDFLVVIGLVIDCSCGVASGWPWSVHIDVLQVDRARIDRARVRPGL